MLNFCFHLLLPTLILSSCFAPKQTYYESARTLGDGHVRVSAGASHTKSYLFVDANRSRSVGLTVGFTDDVDIDIRHEEFESLFLQENLSSTPSNYTYSEIGIKKSLKKNESAVKLSVGRYLFDKDRPAAYSARPQYIMTTSVTRGVEFSGAYDVTILQGRDNYILIPGFNCGFNVSSNLDRWAIRAEVGASLHMTAAVGGYITL